MADVRLVTFTGEVVTPQDDSILYQSATVDGVYDNIKFTISDPTTININRTFAIMGGRFIEIEDQNFTVALAGGAANLVGQIYIKIDLSNTDAPVDIYVETKNSESALTPMTKDKYLNTTNGTYMMSLCYFGVNSSTVYNLEDQSSTDIPVICNKLPLSADFSNANIARIEERISKNRYTTGDYLIYNTQLYRVTATIAVGAELKPGTNITPVSLGSETTSIKNSYVKKTGDTMSGNLRISGTGDKYVRNSNDNGDVSFTISSAGNKGIYDNGNGKWVFKENPAGTRIDIGEVGGDTSESIYIGGNLIATEDVDVTGAPNFKAFKLQAENTDFNTLKPDKNYSYGSYAVHVTDTSLELHRPTGTGLDVTKIWYVETFTGYNAAYLFQKAYFQISTGCRVFIRTCYNGTWAAWQEIITSTSDILKQPVNGNIVSTSFDIETKGNYVQYQNSNSSSNSLVSASGAHLYTLVSMWTGTARGIQYAFTTDGELWARHYQWWGTVGWTPWLRFAKGVISETSTLTKSATFSITVPANSTKSITRADSIGLSQYEEVLGLKDCTFSKDNLVVTYFSGTAIGNYMQQGGITFKVRNLSSQSITADMSVTITYRQTKYL